MHGVAEQYRVAAFERHAQRRGRFYTEELKLHARVLDREIDQDILACMRHVAHADDRAVGFRKRHFAKCGKLSAVIKLVRYPRPQFDVGLLFLRFFAWVGLVGKRRKSPRPHFQSPGDPIVGDTNDSLFVVVVDHAPEIRPSHIGRCVGDAHRRPVLEVAQFVETAPALS